MKSSKFKRMITPGGVGRQGHRAGKEYSQDFSYICQIHMSIVILFHVPSYGK